MFRLSLGALVAILLSPLAAWAATYEVAPGSVITYYVTHPMHEVEGVSTKVRGRVEYDPTTPLDISGVIGKPIQVDWRSFDSGNANRDDNVLAAVNAGKYPTITFVIEGVADPVKRGATVTGTLKGRLYVNGVKTAVEAPARIDASDPSAIKANVKISTAMTAFSIKPPTLLFVATEDAVRIDVDMVLEPKAPAIERRPVAGITVGDRIKLLVAALSFDRSLKARAGDKVTIAVLGKCETGDAIGAEAGKSLSGLPIAVTPLGSFQGGSVLEQQLTKAKAAVLYVCEGGESLAAIVAAASKARTVTIADDPAWVAGELAFGVGEDGGRARLHINNEAAKAQGAEFDPRLFVGAKMIR